MAIFKALANKITSESGADVTKWIDDDGSRALVSQPTNLPQFDGTVVSFVRANANQMFLQNDIIPPLLSQTGMPNGAQGENSSGGFTCTGLDRLANGNWIVGNHGMSSGADPTQTPSIVILNPARTAIVAEFDMSGAILANGGSIQGVAVAADGTYYVAASGASLILHIDTDGSKLGEIAATDVNALAYDATRHGLWWKDDTNATLHFYDLTTSAEITENNFSVSGGIDHITVTDDGYLLGTIGANGVQGIVLCYDTQTKVKVGRLIELENCQAIEGIHYDSTTKIITIANDGGFHTESTPPISISLTYDASELILSRTNFLGLHGKITLTGAAPSNRELIIGHEKAESSAPDVGWALYGMSNNKLRLQVLSQDGNQIVLREWSVTRGVEFSFSIYCDIDTNTIYGEFDGVEVAPSGTTLSSPSALIDGMNSDYYSVGEQATDTFPASFSVKSLGVSTSLAEFNQLATDIQVDPISNTAPSVPTLSASSTSLAAGGTATLTASSTDAENDSITFNWSTDAGILSSTTGNSAVFTAPSGSSAVTATISCTASDGELTSSAGTISIDVAAVVIPDTIKPVINLVPSTLVYNLTVGDTFTLPTATLTDNVDSTISISPVSNTVNTTLSGTYSVVYAGYTDSSGNIADSVTITVNVSPEIQSTTSVSIIDIPDGTYSCIFLDAVSGELILKADLEFISELSETVTLPVSSGTNYEVAVKNNPLTHYTGKLGVTV